MRIKTITQTALLSLVVAALLLVSAPIGKASAGAQGPDIQVQGGFGTPRIARGRAVRATVTMSIPGGYHANAHQVLESYLIPTSLTVTGPGGVRIGAVGYPAGVMKKFGFSNGKALKVYEGRVSMSFTVTVPANFSGNELTLSAKVRVQSCDNQTCYAPRNIETNFSASVSR
jgi:hypothetical protein